MKTQTYIMIQKQFLGLKSSKHSVKSQNAFIRSTEGFLRGKTFKKKFKKFTTQYMFQPKLQPTAKKFPKIVTKTKQNLANHFLREFFLKLKRKYRIT